MTTIISEADRRGMGAFISRLYLQCERESSWEISAHNARTDCYGLFQLSKATAAELGVNRYDWRQNVAGGVAYMATLLRRYQGDYAKALAAFNWGMGHLDKLVRQAGANWRAGLPAETQKYVAYVLNQGGS